MIQIFSLRVLNLTLGQYFTLNFFRRELIVATFLSKKNNYCAARDFLCCTCVFALAKSVKLVINPRGRQPNESEWRCPWGAAAVGTAVFGNRITPIILFRFPENASTPELVAEASRLGLIIASYDVSPEDWRNSPPQESLKRLRQRLNTVDRGVIVMHDIQENTVPLLPMVLAELKARGASIVHVVE